MIALDWGSIRNLRGWGCIQEWGSIQADTVLLNKVVVNEVAGVALFEEIKGNGFERMIYWALVSC